MEFFDNTDEKKSELEITEEKKNELRGLLKIYNKILKENDSYKENINVLEEKKSKLEVSLISFFKIMKKEQLTINKDNVIKAVNIKRVLPANKKYLKQRTLELCDGNELSMETLYNNIFSKEDLEEYEVKKLKIKKIKKKNTDDKSE